MATLTKQFSFNTDQESWVYSANGGTSVAGTRNTSDDSTNDTNAGNGCLQTRRTTANKTDAFPRWKYAPSGGSSYGTYEDLGVPVGATITAVNVDFDWKCSEYTSGATSQVGPCELKTTADVLRATFAAVATFSATTAWATKTGTAFTGLSDASNTQFWLQIIAVPKTASGGTPAVSLLLDWVVVTVTYTPAVAVAGPSVAGGPVSAGAGAAVAGPGAGGGVAAARASGVSLAGAGTGGGLAAGGASVAVSAPGAGGGSAAGGGGGALVGGAAGGGVVAQARAEASAGGAAGGAAASVASGAALGGGSAAGGVGGGAQAQAATGASVGGAAVQAASAGAPAAAGMAGGLVQAAASFAGVGVSAAGGVEATEVVQTTEFAEAGGAGAGGIGAAASSSSGSGGGSGAGAQLTATASAGAAGIVASGGQMDVMADVGSGGAAAGAGVSAGAGAATAGAAVAGGLGWGGGPVLVLDRADLWAVGTLVHARLLTSSGEVEADVGEIVETAQVDGAGLVMFRFLTVGEPYALGAVVDGELRRVLVRMGSDQGAARYWREVVEDRRALVGSS